jgi:hypothetical protein
MPCSKLRPEGAIYFERILREIGLNAFQLVGKWHADYADATDLRGFFRWLVVVAIIPDFIIDKTSRKQPGNNSTLP